MKRIRNIITYFNDADALVDTVVFHTNISADTKEFIEDLIGIAPTVIEAEEG